MKSQRRSYQHHKLSRIDLSQCNPPFFQQQRPMSCTKILGFRLWSCKSPANTSSQKTQLKMHKHSLAKTRTQSQLQNNEPKIKKRKKKM